MKVIRFYRSFDPLLGGVVSSIKYTNIALVNDHDVEVIVFDNIALEEGVVSVSDCNSLYGFSVSGLFRAIKAARFADAILVEGSWCFYGVIASVAAKINNIPYFYIPHGMLDSYFNSVSLLKYLKKFIYWLLVENFVVNGSNGVLFTCQKELDMSIKTFPFFNAESYILPLCTDDQILLGRGKVSGPWNPSVTYKVLFLSRLHPKKGLEILFEALSLLPDDFSWQLVIAGVGEIDYVDSLKSLADDLGVTGNIVWYGFADTKSRSLLYQECDFMVLTSYQENFGLVVPECLSFNKPVLISKGVYIWDVVDSYKSGVVCDVDVVSILNGFLEIFRIIDSDGFGALPRTCFLDCFSESSYLERFNSLVSPHVRS